ncbi:MAG: DUF3093 domain-containing protein [Mycobacteriales bacterium]
MTDYEERLAVPAWWWPVAAGIVGLLGAEFHVGLPLAWKVGTYVTFGALAAGLLAFAGAARVGVRNGQLVAGPATLPLRYAGEVRVLDRAATRALMGPSADPAAYTYTRPWLAGSVRVEVRDPDDDTPYWLVGSRKPDRLAAALERTRGRN